MCARGRRGAQGDLQKLCWTCRVQCVSEVTSLHWWSRGPGGWESQTDAVLSPELTLSSYVVLGLLLSFSET